MELREFAEQILFARTLAEKLRCPDLLTDERPGEALPAPEMPGRPADLQFKPRNTGKADLPGRFCLDRPQQRGRLLHFFANHELLATELMALVLLRFPSAPPAFRRGVLQTLKDEQNHTRMYLERMRACGNHFGELPVSGYFWRAISGMESPLDYVAGLSLTFEQANLDFTRLFARAFAQVGDAETAALLERIYRDEIGHVAYGLKWFRQWKNPRLSDWEAFRGQLKFPMSAQRAKGPVFNAAGRLAAGFDRQFVDELNIYSQSKGRTPGIFVFNPFAEGRIAKGKSFTPNRYQQQLRADLENLPQFLCRQDDVVLLKQRPSASFLGGLKTAGYAAPEFVEVPEAGLEAATDLCGRKLGRLSPWAWGPDSLELLEPLFPKVTVGSRNPDDYYNTGIGQLYSKQWSAEFLRKMLSMRGQLDPARVNWLCPEQEAGMAASTLAEALAQVEAIRKRGHHRVVIKEALGIAGHNAIRLFEPELLESQSRWIAGAVENGRRVIVEPWLERQVDFSVQLQMTPPGLKLVGYTGLWNDPKGQFRGNWAWPGFHRRICVELPRHFPGVPDISRQVLGFYSEIFSSLEQQLRNLKYSGPVGIDAFVYQMASGENRLKPIVEINPRYTMGRLTLELMRNVAPGRTGSMRLINRNMIKNAGFADFSSWARAASERLPLRLEGEPVPKLTEGMVCLNDPERAQVCLAIFEVGRYGERIGKPIASGTTPDEIMRLCYMEPIPFRQETAQ